MTRPPVAFRNPPLLDAELARPVGMPGLSQAQNGAHKNGKAAAARVKASVAAVRPGPDSPDATPAMLRVMRLLPGTPAQVAARLGCERDAVGDILRRAQERGLVRRGEAVSGARTRTYVWELV